MPGGGIPAYQIKTIESVKEALVDNKLTTLDKERLKKAVRGNPRGEPGFPADSYLKPTSI